MPDASRKARVVVVAREQSYVSGELSAAAEKLDIELVFASDRCHVLAEMWPANSIPVDMAEPAAAARAVATALAGRSVAATLGTDESTAIVAEAIALELGVPTGLSGAAARAADKLATRVALSEAGLAQPGFVLASLAEPAPLGVSFPAVVKPRCLSASRGVVRVDSAAELAVALDRLRAILADPEIRGRYGELASSVVIEDYVAGPEIALEGVLIGGELETLAVFDKPRPLDGPHFAETLYVMPTSLSPADAERVARACARAAAALGLREGPIHAELRLGAGEPVVIELAARSIGGLCGRTLRLATGWSVAEIVLARVSGLELALGERRPAGVAMLAPHAGGVFVGMRGVDDVERLPGVVQVEITAPIGQRVTPVPDGSDYLGFVFASGESRAEVIATLERAETLLRAEIRSAL